MREGRFIVLEGINGCGKGTQFDLLHSYIRDSGKAVPIFSTGEPSQFSEYGKRARDILGSDGDPYSNNVEAVEYFSKDRRVHNEVFVPLLERGVDVISDRYWHSNFAFQCAQGVSWDDVADANVDLRKPNLTYIIDVTVDIAFDRLSKRDAGNRRKFDRNRDFMEKVRQNYLELPCVLPNLTYENLICVVDGDRKPKEVFAEIREVYDYVFGDV